MFDALPGWRSKNYTKGKVNIPTSANRRQNWGTGEVGLVRGSSGGGRRDEGSYIADEGGHGFVIVLAPG